MLCPRMSRKKLGWLRFHPSSAGAKAQGFCLCVLHVEWWQDERMDAVLTPGFPRVSGHVCTSAQHTLHVCTVESEGGPWGNTLTSVQHFEPRACLIRRRKEGNEEAEFLFFFLEAFINEV